MEVKRYISMVVFFGISRQVNQDHPITNLIFSNIFFIKHLIEMLLKTFDDIRKMWQNYE